MRRDRLVRGLRAGGGDGRRRDRGLHLLQQRAVDRVRVQLGGLHVLDRWELLPLLPLPVVDLAPYDTTLSCSVIRSDLQRRPPHGGLQSLRLPRRP